jgi:hypothetical protein
MSFNVRVFGYRGTTQLPVSLEKAFHADSVQVLSEPYEFGQKLVSNGATPVSSAPDSDHAQVKLLRVEVPDGEAIRYEIGPSGTVRDPGDTSPRLSGSDNFEFAPGWVFSFVDAASFP